MKTKKVNEDSIKQQLNSTEVLKGFCSWLTTRHEVTIMSKIHDASAVPLLIERFCEANNLPEVRKDWEKNFVIPE